VVQVGDNPISPSTYRTKRQWTRACIIASIYATFWRHPRNYPRLNRTSRVVRKVRSVTKEMEKVDE